MLLRIAACILMATLVGCFNQQYVYELAHGEPLTESAAIRLARRALQDSGIPVQGLEPVTYWPSGGVEPEQRFFAQSITDKNRGYVLWREAKSEKTWDYQVSLVRTDDQVICTVSRPK